MTSESNAAETSGAGAAMQPRIAAPEQAEALRPFGIDMKVMPGAEHTGGTFSAIVAEVKPGEGPPPHLHRDREEYFYLLEGTYQLVVNGRETTVGPGILVFVPRETAHAFKNVASTAGAMKRGLSASICVHLRQIDLCHPPHGRRRSARAPARPVCFRPPH